jgi:hypothetical protein
MVFDKVRRVHGTLQFIHSRAPDYIRLAREEVGAICTSLKISGHR